MKRMLTGSDPLAQREKAAPALIEAIQHENELVRGNAAAMLGNMMNKEAVPAQTEAVPLWTGRTKKNGELALQKIDGKYPRAISQL